MGLTRSFLASPLDVSQRVGQLNTMTPQEYVQQKAANSGSSFYYAFLFLPANGELPLLLSTLFAEK